MSQFQSHNGAIAAPNGTRISHKTRLVSIPQWCDCCLATISSLITRLDGFNPTMVRLLHGYAYNLTDPDLCFNPTMVRLLRVAV